MIDCENEVFNAVAQKVRAVYPGLYMTGEYTRSPASFPCVSIEEKNNAVWRNSRDTSSNEKTHFLSLAKCFFFLNTSNNAFKLSLHT